MTCSRPSRSRPLTTARDGRATVAWKPGTLRQPSSSSCIPSRSTNSGLTNVMSSAGLSPDRDVGDEDAQARRRPACAARPIPGAAYIVWIMSSMSCVNLRRDLADRRRGLVEHLVPIPENRTDHAGVRAANRRRTCSAVACVMPLDFVDRVAAKLLEERIREDERHHRFADDGRGGHGADVAALDGGRCLGHRAQVHRSQRLHQRGDRFHEAGHAHVLAVGDAAFEAAGVVGGPHRRVGRRPAAGSRRARASRAAPRPPGRCRCRRP